MRTLTCFWSGFSVVVWQVRMSADEPSSGIGTFSVIGDGDLAKSLMQQHCQK
jgi:hypothetical protein